MDASEHLAMVLTRHAGGNERLAEMLMLSVGRIVKKAHGDNARSTMSTLGQHEQAIRHVADWLKAALINDTPWLRNLDAEGRTKKLMKFGTLEAIRREADKDMLKMAQGHPRVLIEGAEEVVETLGDGYSIVRLLTPEALVAESAEMQHCIGHGAYDDLLTGDNNLFLSLRDPKGRAHATVHIAHQTVIQISGKQNAVPIPRYLLMFASYITSQGCKLGDIGNGHSGWVVDVDGNLYPMDGLPDELRVPGNVYLKGNAPTSVIAGGEVSINLLDGERPPVRIEAAGDICLFGRGFKKVPEHLRCGRELVIEGTSIETLPRGLSVSGLSLTSTPLRTLPDDIVNTGDLTLERTGVTELPDSLWRLEDGKIKSHGRVNIVDTPVSSLGSLEVVTNDLVINGTEMRSLPDGLHVKGRLSVSSRTTEFRVPKRLSVTGSMTINIEGDLIFLGRDLKVTLGLSVRGHNIRFPRSVECRSFVLTHSTVHAMPLRMSAQNSIQIDNSKITRFPRHMEAPKICFGRGTLTGFLGRIAGLSGSVKAEIIMVSDRPLKIGRGVIAEKVLFVDENLDCTTMSVGEARSYLGAHKRHARRGVAFTELVRATVRHMPKPFFKFGKGVASGRPIVYDEFHRSAR